jgi:hypothetical protein
MAAPAIPKVHFMSYLLVWRIVVFSSDASQSPQVGPHAEALFLRNSADTVDDAKRIPAGIVRDFVRLDAISHDEGIEDRRQATRAIPE